MYWKLRSLNIQATQVTMVRLSVVYWFLCLICASQQNLQNVLVRSYTLVQMYLIIHMLQRLFKELILQNKGGHPMMFTGL